jgi:hypothetical protein
MAQISFKGFVEEWTKNTPAHPGWGMKVSESHQKKEGDAWVTIARTYRTVKAGWDVEIDFSQFKKGDLVEITGKELTETSEKDGKTYSNLVVKADTVTIVPVRGAAPAEDNSPF